MSREKGSEKSAQNLLKEIIASLFRVYGTSTQVSLYVVAALCVTGVALLMARETATSPLEE